MKLHKLMVFILAAVTFISCKKDDSRHTTNNGNYIDKIYSLWDDGTGMDTMSILTVTYDDLKRVVSMSNGSDENWQYFYNGSDMNPYKAVIQAYSPNPDTIFYTFNSSGLKIKDSVINYPDPTPLTSVTEYQYLPGKIVAYEWHYGGSTVTTDTATLDANGNILENWHRTYITSPLMEISAVHSFFGYDNHPHPFSAMNIFNSNRDLPFGETFLMEMFTPNNRTTQNEINSSPFNFNVTYSYEYNANGFPTKITATDSGDTEITLIQYRSL